MADVFFLFTKRVPSSRCFCFPRGCVRPTRTTPFLSDAIYSAFPPLKWLDQGTRPSLPLFLDCFSPFLPRAMYPLCTIEDRFRRDTWNVYFATVSSPSFIRTRCPPFFFPPGAARKSCFFLNLIEIVLPSLLAAVAHFSFVEHRIVPFII